ncbi:MAG TPA: PRC-barrel domain-containing protein, partial [Geminicoccaceae bacterium]|nr:PRC-barrel domain-containing protein [Geminicoccaceae bacterium]
MRTALIATSAMALALLVANLDHAGAQDSDTGGNTGAMTTTPNDASDDAIGTRGPTVGTGDVATGTAAGAGEQWYSGMGGDEIVGPTLYSSDGQEIGEIENVVMRQGGSNPEALVGVGGFLGIGERSVTIPLDQIQKQDDRLTTSMSKESLGAMQAYDESGYQDWDSSR